LEKLTSPSPELVARVSEKMGGENPRTKVQSRTKKTNPPKTNQPNTPHQHPPQKKKKKKTQPTTKNQPNSKGGVQWPSQRQRTVVLR